MWGTLGIDDKRETFGDEVDLTVGKKLSVAGLNIDLSGSYFVLSKFGDHTNDLYVFDGRVELPNKIPWVTPWVAIRYFGRVGKNSPKAGWFGWVGVQRAQPIGFRLPLQKDIFTLNFDGWTAFSMGGAFGGNAGPVYARLRASTKLAINDKSFITPWVMWQAPIQDAGHYVDGKDHVLYGISMTYTF